MRLRDFRNRSPRRYSDLPGNSKTRLVTRNRDRHRYRDRDPKLLLTLMMPVSSDPNPIAIPIPMPIAINRLALFVCFVVQILVAIEVPPTKMAHARWRFSTSAEAEG